jgi:tripartite ATP-independent transporter DctM subunit
MTVMSIETTTPSRALSVWVRAVDRRLGQAVEVPAALLVVAEMVVLLCGVVSRYVLHRPLVWSDELASMLFIWLAMLGSVVAFRRGEHMRMTAVVGLCGSRTRAFLDILAIVVAGGFVGLMIGPAIEFAQDEAFVITPALQVTNAWSAAALPVGFTLMLIFTVLRLIEKNEVVPTLAALALGATIVGTMMWIGPAFRPLGNLNLVVFFVVGVGVCVFSGVPIAVAFGIATLGYVGLTTHAPISVVVGRMNEGMSHLILLAIPLFVFLGLLIESTGLAKAMVGFLANLLGHVRGGLHYVLVGAMYLVSGISGSKAADMAAVAPVLFPEMKQRGAKEGDLVALLAATGAQTETIPPSLVLITIGSVTGVSITALFTGGLLPGVVLGVALCGLVWWRYRNEDLSGVRRAPWSEIAKSGLVAAPALALPFVIRAAVVEGVATATEVSTLGIVYTLLVGGLFYRRLDLARFYPMLLLTAGLSGAILLIIGAATGMAWALTQSGFSQALAETMRAMPGGPLGFLAISAVAFVILGSVLEGIPSIVLFGPLLFPIARQVGVNDVHYAMVVVLAMGVGLFAPPFGVGYYSACAISRIHPDAGIRPLMGYIGALIVGLTLVVVFPSISLCFL